MTWIILLAIGLICFAGYVGWTLGELTGRIRSDKEHLEWLGEMDEKFGDIKDDYRAEAQRIAGKH